VGSSADFIIVSDLRDSSACITHDGMSSLEFTKCAIQSCKYCILPLERVTTTSRKSLIRSVLQEALGSTKCASNLGDATAIAACPTCCYILASGTILCAKHRHGCWNDVCFLVLKAVS
jgi:hypothetical protein